MDMQDPRDLYELELGKLESFVRRLLTPEWKTLQDLWELQLDLLAYQLEFPSKLQDQEAQKTAIRAEIRTTGANRPSGFAKQLADLQMQLKQVDSCIVVHRYSRDLARRIGDAFAWLLFRGRRHFLEPLAQNKATPAPAVNAGLEGVINTARLLAAGAGFPVLHDITNMLRVGDVTFVSERDPVTVEVKTHAATEPGACGTVDIHLVNPPEEIDQVFSNAELLASQSGGELVVERGQEFLTAGGGRFSRQTARMKEARLLQTAIPGTVLSELSSPFLIVAEPDTGHNSHWSTMRELAHEAKLSGKASRIVQPAALYTAIATGSPASLPWSSEVNEDFKSRIESIPQELVSSGIFSEDRSKNALWFATTENHLEDVAPIHVQPLFTYHLDVDLMVDLLWGRLTFGVFIVTGKIIEALEQAGFQAELPLSGGGGTPDFLRIRRVVSMPDGATYEVELRNTSMQCNRLLYDYLSVDAFISLVHEMFSVSAETVAERRAKAVADEA